VVPEGTQMLWSFNTQNNNQLLIHFGDSAYTIPTGSDRANFKQTAQQSAGYSIQTSNQYIPFGDSIHYRIQVIPDLHPSITMQEEKDSTSFKWAYFTGEVKDDYGFRRLTFNYRLNQRNGEPSQDNLHTIDLPINTESTGDIFFHSWNLGELGIMPGDVFTYYFEIWDNDGFRGSKSATTGEREYLVPSEDELEKNIEEQNQDIKDKLEESVKEAKDLEKQLEELQRQLLDKQEMNWQDKKKLEELMKRQQELQKQVEEIQEQNQQKNKQEKGLQIKKD
jgi:hypothetical protein